MSDDKKKTDTSCTFPYEMYSIDTQFGLWRPCPRIDYMGLDNKEFNNHPRLVELRKNLRNGIQDELCHRCWKDEREGTKSYRQVLGQDKQSHFGHLNEIPAPKIFEIKFSNLCNLKCVFCSSLCSSLWEKDIPLDKTQFGKIRGDELTQSSLSYLKKNIEEIQVIQLFGGEPLLHKEFYDVLDFLLDDTLVKSKKTISFSTNFYFSSAIREKFETYVSRLLDKGHDFYLRLSIDGIEDRGEYLRTGLNWDVFDRNFRSMAKKFGAYEGFGRIRCNIALNALNLMSLHQIMDYIHHSDFNIIVPHYNYIGKPERFTLQTYGHRLKWASDQIKDQNFFEYTHYKDHVIDLIESIVHRGVHQETVEECQSWLRDYDKKRDNLPSFEDTFPENKYLFEDMKP